MEFEENITMNQKYALGVDIGGTKTAFGVVSSEGEISYHDEIHTRDYATAEDLIKEISKRLKENNQGDFLGIGIGAPNGNSKTGHIEYAPNLTWKGIVPICELFEEFIGARSILINDANAAAVGERMFGNAKDLDHFVTITLGTGLGSGIIIDGHLVEGQHGFAGEYGHIRVKENGRLCGCGRLGCLETYASSTGVVRTLKEWYAEIPDSSTLKSLQNPDAHAIFNCWLQGDAFAEKIVDFTSKILGEALADFACFSDPKAYVLFGGIAQSGQAFVDKVKKDMENHMIKVLEDKIEIRLSSLHEQNAAILGAAATTFWKFNREINV
jgi:glucokinase